MCKFLDEWEVPSATGKISVVKKFDDTFFGIFSGVAGMMDPLTRVAIERAYEAIMDAGKSLSTISSVVYNSSSRLSIEFHQRYLLVFRRESKKSQTRKYRRIHKLLY